MKTKRDIRRADLKARLTAAAEERIKSSGLAGLRARDITADAGCALGALYTAFEDLDDLVLHLNSATLARLGRALSEEVVRTAEPRARLKGLARAYSSFARDNPTLWAALFEHRMTSGAPVPEWLIAEQAVLIQILVEPLARLRPALGKTDLLARARTLFSAVHGIVAISLENRFIGLAPSDLDAELLRFVEVMVTGIENTPET